MESNRTIPVRQRVDKAGVSPVLLWNKHLQDSRATNIFEQVSFNNIRLNAYFIIKRGGSCMFEPAVLNQYFGERNFHCCRWPTSHAWLSSEGFSFVPAGFSLYASVMHSAGAEHVPTARAAARCYTEKKFL
jgi:hypothetical protein